MKPEKVKRDNNNKRKTRRGSSRKGNEMTQAKKKKKKRKKEFDSEGELPVCCLERCGHEKPGQYGYHTQAMNRQQRQRGFNDSHTHTLRRKHEKERQN